MTAMPCCSWEDANPGMVPTTVPSCETTPPVPRVLQGNSRDGGRFCDAASILPLKSAQAQSHFHVPQSCPKTHIGKG